MKSNNVPSIQKDHFKTIQETEVNCEEIWWRPGHGTTFYENNPTYVDNSDDTDDWKFSSPGEQGMSLSVLEEGISELESSPFIFSVLIVKNEHIVLEKYFNGSDVHHSNNIHSSSKSMLPALVGIAIEEGFIDNVNQKAAEFLPKSNNKRDVYDVYERREIRYENDLDRERAPYVPEQPPHERVKGDITLHHLMSMSAGLHWVEDHSEYFIEDSADWVESILRYRLLNFPGEKFNYNTGLTHVLSAVIAKSTGMGLCDFAHQHLFLPLGITAEHWGRDPQGINSGGYNLYMTSREMAKFGLLYLNKGKWDGIQIVPQWMVDLSLEPHMKVNSVFNYGYCWWLRELAEYQVYIAWGFGGQFIYLIPELDIVFVSTSDTANNPEGQEINEVRFVRDFLIPSIERIRE